LPNKKCSREDLLICGTTAERHFQSEAMRETLLPKLRSPIAQVRILIFIIQHKIHADAPASLGMGDIQKCFLPVEGFAC